MVSELGLVILGFIVDGDGRVNPASLRILQLHGVQRASRRRLGGLGLLACLSLVGAVVRPSQRRPPALEKMLYLT